MTKKTETEKFKPRARLLLQLGDQLIRNENIAIVELVKNAYDADATECKIFFNDIDSEKSGEIIIQDNGIGMTLDVIKHVWLEPGSDFKDLILRGKTKKLKFNFVTPKRTPIGEKGVGRFGAHKIGDFIQLVTKDSDSNKEIVVEIDWSVFAKKKYLEDVTFNIHERTPKFFTGSKSGTRILVKKLKKTWDKPLYRELQRTLLSLNSPFQKKSSFCIKPYLRLEDASRKKDWQEMISTPKDILKQALWKLNCTLNGNEITDFRFEFNPSSGMDKLERRIIQTKDLLIRTIKYKEGRSERTVDLNKYRIGPIKIEAYLFDLGTKILKLGFQDPKSLKDFLAQNGGVRVYRDGLRVYDYGERENDWLNLDKMRINEPVKKISNRNILAAVQLNRKESMDLIEKTNREGFVENNAYTNFQHAVGAVIDIFAQQRNIDKLLIRKLYEGSSKTQPVLHDIDELKSLIENKLSKTDIKDKDGFRENVFSGLDRIGKQYTETNKVLLKSAGAGLSLSVVIHEIDKRLKELVNVLSAKIFDVKRVRGLVNSIAKLVNNYSVLVAKERKRNVSVKRIIEDAIFNSEFRFKAHKVNIVRKFEKAKDTKVDCALNIIVGMLLNIFDNSLYWLHAYEIKEKKILIDLKEYDKNKVSIIIADNSKGFTISPEDAIQPFITTKPGGMGLGLHIVSEMMKTHEGVLIIRDYKETKDIPKEFENGAILELIFKKK